MLVERKININMQPSNRITQNNFYHTFRKLDANIKLQKQQCVNYGQSLKILIASDDKTLIDALNNIATRIQKRINRGNLTYNEINRYRDELIALIGGIFTIQIENQINNFFKCCIVLSKHDTDGETKNNYFYITNKTGSLKQLSETSLTFHGVKSINSDALNTLLGPEIITTQIGDKTYITQQLNNENSIDANCTNSIALAIANGRFGVEKEVLTALATSLAKMNFTDPDAQRTIANEFNNVKFDVISIDKTKLQKHILSNWVINQYEQYINSNDNTLHHQFGATDFTETNYPKKITNGNTYIAIDVCFEGSGTLGVTYNKTGEPNFLIVLKGTHSNDPEFIGYFYGDSKLKYLYHDNLFKNLKIYNLKILNQGYPSVIDDLTKKHTEYESFPKWLQSMIDKSKFNYDDYQSSKIIKFVIETIVGNIKCEAELKKTCISIIQQIIKKHGDYVNVSSDPQIDAQIKKKINDEFAAEMLNDDTYKDAALSLKGYYDTLQLADKLKLTFLLAQIAKRGALGYHLKVNNGNQVVEDNCANTLFYYLTNWCIEQLKNNQDKGIKSEMRNAITQAHTDLMEGICIETISNDFADVMNDQNFNLRDVFMKV